MLGECFECGVPRALRASSSGQLARDPHKPAKFVAYGTSEDRLRPAKYSISDGLAHPKCVFVSFCQAAQGPGLTKRLPVPSVVRG
jgi:hypothetical protein